MTRIRRMIAMAALVILASLQAALAGPRQDLAGQTLRDWYALVLELVRHTPTYSPPVASRAFSYVGVTAFETVASGGNGLRSLAGQLNQLTPPPSREANEIYDDAVALNAAMSFAVADQFGHTGPTGQRVLARFAEKTAARVAEAVDPAVVARSIALGEAIARHIQNWSLSDGGAKIDNLGFPAEYQLVPGPAHWVPTNPISLQQTPLLPSWGANRPFVLKDGAECGLPPPPDYSEAEGSEFRRQAVEVYDAVRALTPEHKAIARFWSDDPMLSPTPPGHWISIALQIFERDGADLPRTVDVLARLGIAVADGFIGCWHEKFRYDLVRPVTYIRRLIDAKWEPLLITPPFPEYPSGHSSQSGAAEVVLANLFGDPFAFEDATHERDGIAPRHFSSFREAADEAGISRLYGGIHFRAAIERGLDQGRCIGARVNALKTRD